jgi:hypothetical protein
MNTRNKIIILWIVFLLGLLFHTDLGLMPLFHNLSVVSSPATNMDEISLIMWLMLGFFIPPMAAIIATAFINSKSYRKLHFALSLVYTMLNFSHLIADLMVKPIVWYQITLMVILLIIGLLINIVSFQWIKEYIKEKNCG